LANPRDENALNRLAYLIREAREANRNIIDAKKPEKELLKAIASLQKQLQALLNACEDGKIDKAVQEAKKVASEINNRVY
jgi:DNA repair exonuclease SbcCD ATPase subunit